MNKPLPIFSDVQIVSFRLPDSILALLVGVLPQTISKARQLE